MARAVKISEALVAKATVYAKSFHRSTAGQIEYWAKIGQLAEENPQLPYSFIRDTLLGLDELKAGQVEPYVFGDESGEE